MSLGVGMKAGGGAVWVVLGGALEEVLRPHLSTPAGPPRARNRKRSAQLLIVVRLLLVTETGLRLRAASKTPEPRLRLRVRNVTAPISSSRMFIF